MIHPFILFIFCHQKVSLIMIWMVVLEFIWELLAIILKKYSFWLLDHK